MKNLLVYIRDSHGFYGDSIYSSKIQIDNSLDLGWKKADLVVVTNFEWEYNGVKAIVVPDEHWDPQRPRSIKTAIIPFLIKQGIIGQDEWYWNHDFDAYQMHPFAEADLGIAGFDVGLTDYGWQPRWCLGSYFVRDTALDIFEKARPIILQNIEDETAMMQLSEDPAIQKRCKRLNVTFNFGMRQVESNYQKADKPIKVLHFHPYDRGAEPLKVFMRGDNALQQPLMSERLIKIFNQHGIK